MNQVENFGATASQAIHVVHEAATGAGLAPVPTMIILGLGAMFALVGMVVGGQGRGRAARHLSRS